MEIYLDNNSSTPIDERVLAIMENVYLHSYGIDNVSKMIEIAKSLAV